MALDVNTGYSNVFKTFVDFAQQRVNANDASAIADAHVQKPLGGRKIIAITQSLTDSVHKWTRGVDEWVVNDRTRELFKKAIADMFGGENKIPASVKKAMVMSDYGEGKPLTARRILAVKAAIDADGTAKARAESAKANAERIKLETFVSHDVEGAALELGFTKAELPKLARAAHFYALATGKSEMDAMKEVAKPGSDANRLMDYGGRFMQNAGNFAEGLRLVKLFSQWHDGLSAARNGVFGRPATYAGADTPSKINMDVRASNPMAKLGLERFLFEDIAVNPGFNLKEADAERAFGVEHNKASRFMTVAQNTSTIGTLANIPPEKRRVVFAAFNAFSTLAATGPERNSRKFVNLESMFLSRVIRNLPKLEAVFAKTGTLTGRDVIKNAFPDIRHPGNYDGDTIKAWEDALIDGVQRQGGKMAAVTTMLENTGATLREVVGAVSRGKELPHLPYVSGAQYSIEEASSVANAGISTMNGDINRLSLYMTGEGENAKSVFSEESHAWKFAFPDGERLETSGTKHADIPKVGQKIRQLCGEVHQKQIGAVALLLSQSGMGALRGKALAKYGIETNEHTPVNFALSRDDETGAVTIRYSSPSVLPVQFSWTATVAVDGSVTSTPFVIEKPVKQLDNETAAAMVAERAKALGVELSDAQRDQAVSLLRTHGTNMFAKNAKLFAGFVVQQVRTRGTAEKKEKIAADTAKSIREWRDFEFGDQRNVEFRNAAKDYASNTIRQYMQPEKAGEFKDNILGTMIDDANRAVYTFNGTTYIHRPKDEVISAFKTLVPDAKKQKALSTYLNQLCLETTFLPSNHVPYDTGVVAHELPGANMLLNRDMTTGLYQFSILGSKGHDLFHDVQISPDGKTATITQSISGELNASGEVNMAEVNFGKVTIRQRLVINLEPEIPVVTDFQLAQTIDV